MHNNLTNISDLSVQDINEIINIAKAFKENKLKCDLSNKFTTLMFFENSTRTKVSFQVAAKKLNLNVVDFDINTSSINKGESLKDTLENLYHIGINSAVIRHSENNIIKNTINELDYPIRLINAGTGNEAHPTQALLDYFTMIEKFRNIQNKKISIIGDILHSRVAKSNIALLKKFGANITICAPEYFKPQENLGINYTNNLIDAISNSDVVMMLRIQKERIKEEFSIEEYIRQYRLNTEIFEKYAPNAILMHPGPVNRDIEISSDLLNSTKGKTILLQAQNGVYIRMAIYYLILGGV